MSRTNVVTRYRTELRERFIPDRVPETTTAMAAVTLVLWTLLLSGWLPTPSLPGPMAAPGVPEAMGTTNGLGGVIAYLLGWGVMMSAMMYPSMIPLARRYADELDDERPEDAVGYLTATFGTYSLVWAATGVVPLLVDAVLDVSALTGAIGPFLVGGLGLFVAGYQQSDLKRDALTDCCCGVDVDEPSLHSAVSSGVEHAVNCITATWPFFALMVVAGSMNPTVMLAFAFVIAAERLPADRTVFTDAIGLVAGAAGVVVLLLPGLLP